MIDLGPDFYRRCVAHCTIFVCFLSGVDLCKGGDSYTPHCRLSISKLRKYCILMIRFSWCVEFFLFNVAQIRREYLRMNGSISSSDVIKAGFVLAHPVVHVQFIRCLWANQKSLAQLLRDPLHVSFINHVQFVVYFFSWIQFTVNDIHFALDDIKKKPSSARYYLESTMSRLCGLHVQQCQYLILILFSEAQEVLRGHLDRLYASLLEMSHSEILREKQVIREITASVNKTFSTAFSLFYVKVFLFFYLFLHRMIFLKGGLEPSLLFSLGSATQVLLLYDLASGGTKIIEACRRTAFKMLSGDPRSQSDSDFNSLSRVVQLLTYDEVQDSLKVSDCFLFCKQSFLSYVALIITCIAVMLQFDYQILVKLDNDKVLYNLRVSAIGNSSMGL